MKRIISTLLLSMLSGILFGYAEGPDAGVSGVPREATCSACHRGSNGLGSVKVDFPGGLTYAPGVPQHLVVTITDSAQKRWGFQLAARQSANSSMQAGTFTPGRDHFTQIVCTQTNFQSENFGSCPPSMPLQYVEHTKDGTRNGTRGPVTFEFDWTPPATSPGEIAIYINANAANGDGGDGGDHIYAQHYLLTEQRREPAISSAGIDGGAALLPFASAGSWITIKGTGLANSTRTCAASEIMNGVLPRQLDGVGVTVNGAPGFVYSISPEQINAIAPADTAVGPIAVQVTNNGATSTPATVTLQTAAPVPFLWGARYAVATRPDYSYVGPSTLYPGLTTPARPGEVVILWCAGLGATTPAVAPGALAPASPIAYTADAPKALIGNVPATVYGAALAPGMAGLYQLAIQVPSGLAEGDQPVVIQLDGTSSPSGIYLNVHP